MDGREFDGWRDADDLLGPILEVFRGSRYFWLPVDQVRTLRFGDEEGFRDRRLSTRDDLAGRRRE